MTDAQTHGRTAARISGLALAVLCVGAPVRLCAQSWRTITSARQLHGEREMAVEVQYAAGRFRLTPGGQDELYRMEMRYDEDKFTPLREFDPDAETLRLGLRGRDGRSGMRVSLGDRRRSSTPPWLDLSLTPDIPISLTMHLGAVQADVELGGLALRSVHYTTGASETRLRFSEVNPVACEELEMEAGAAEFHADQLANANCARVRFSGGVGEVTLDFGGEWRRSMTASVNVGIGALNLRLPREVGVSVRLNRFLASFDAAGFEKRGNTYYTSNFNSARYRLTLDVNASFGGVDVAWIGR